MVLLAEDDPEVSSGLASAFKQAGYKIEVVTNGSEIIARAIALQPDVIATKKFLPEMNGDTEVRASSKQLPTLMRKSRQHCRVCQQLNISSLTRE